jgi:hypothetical protein
MLLWYYYNRKESGLELEINYKKFEGDLAYYLKLDIF